MAMKRQSAEPSNRVAYHEKNCLSPPNCGFRMPGMRAPGKRLNDPCSASARYPGFIPDPPALWGCVRRLAGDGRTVSRRPHARHRPQQLPTRPGDGHDRSSPVVPAVNQIETHPFNQQIETQKFLQENGVQIESWGPFAKARITFSKTSCWFRWQGNTRKRWRRSFCAG